MMGSGVQSVMRCGMPRMLTYSVHNWDFPDEVNVAV